MTSDLRVIERNQIRPTGTSLGKTPRGPQPSKRRGYPPTKVGGAAERNLLKRSSQEEGGRLERHLLEAGTQADGGRDRGLVHEVGLTRLTRSRNEDWIADAHPRPTPRAAALPLPFLDRNRGPSTELRLNIKLIHDSADSWQSQPQTAGG